MATSGYRPEVAAEKNDWFTGKTSMPRQTNYRFEKLQREKRKAEKKAEKAKRRELGEVSSDDLIENDNPNLHGITPHKTHS